MNLSEIKTKSISDLIDIATDLGIEDVGRLKKQDIIFRIFKQQASEGSDIFGGGVLEILNDGFGFLRSTEILTVPVQMIFMFHRAKLESLRLEKVMKFKAR